MMAFCILCYSGSTNIICFSHTNWPITTLDFHIGSSWHDTAVAWPVEIRGCLCHMKLTINLLPFFFIWKILPSGKCISNLYEDAGCWLFWKCWNEKIIMLRIQTILQYFYKMLIWLISYWFSSKPNINITFSFATNHSPHQQFVNFL